MSEYRIETKCVQGGYTPGNVSQTDSHLPGATFKYDTK